MSGNLFHVKAWAFAEALSSLKSEIEQSNAKSNALPIPSDDGMIRMVLSSPEVMQEVRKQFSLQYCRVRLALPEVIPNDGVPAMPALEVYTVEGVLAADPVPASALDIPLSNAVQVELLHFLLKQKGLDIPML